MDSSDLSFETLQNDYLRLDYLTGLGPRIIGLYLQGVDGNLLAVTPEAHWPTPHGEYFLHGGHRLWTAPEDLSTMCPEYGVEIDKEENQVQISGPVELSGLQKEMAIELDGNRVHVRHRVIWHGEKQAVFAPWALTQARLGGMAILPLPTQEGRLPDRNFVLWPYSLLRDERLELHDDLLLVHGHWTGRPFKIGTLTTLGWMAYALENALFLKHFSTGAEGSFPDRGCNVETYVGDTFIELETLGALSTLKPGDSMTHEETWEIIAGKYPATLETAREILARYSSKS